MIAGKVWGRTELLFEQPGFSMHRLVLKRGGYSSKHFHRHMWNGFYVATGKVMVAVEKKAYGLVDRTTLGPGDKMEVPPGETHWFEALEVSVMYEVYWPAELNQGDIERISIGGIGDGKSGKELS